MLTGYQSPIVLVAKLVVSGLFAATMLLSAAHASAQACVDDSVCAGRPCVDGYCCDDACGGGDTTDCQACNLTGFEGFCSPIEDTTYVCDDANACTQTDTCSAGVCTGTNLIVCTALDPCHEVGTCDTTSGICDDPLSANTKACDDADACTQTDTCLDGTCTGTNPVVCTALDQCHEIGTCDTTSGICDDPLSANTKACDDADACTQTDTCLDGTCTGTNPVVCTALDQCHEIGTCDATSGACDDPLSANTKACDDANSCTQTDTCLDGTCTGTNPVVCTALDQCHEVGACDTTSGTCDDPLSANTKPCDDADTCTESDVCTDGTCGGAPVSNATPCDDGDLCTETDVCTDGVCDGAALDCTHLDDPCMAGVCDDSDGSCSGVPVADDTACDDGNPCTENTVCAIGVCGGGGHIVDATVCDDANPCTEGDQCAAGVCEGTPTIAGTACGDQCNTGICDGTSGTCTTSPMADGTECDDGDHCTGADQCTTGTCAGSAAAAEGASCDDGSSCTSADSCSSGVCDGNPTDCSHLDEECYVGVCLPSNGLCSITEVEAGTPCDDGDQCTTSDGCFDGFCEGSEASDGTECDDDDECTIEDSCQLGVCTGGVDTCSEPEADTGAEDTMAPDAGEQDTTTSDTSEYGPDALEPAESSDEGCSCRVRTATSGQGTLPLSGLLLAFGAVFFMRRRRR